MKFIAYDPNSGEKLSLKEHIHHMDKYTTYIFFSDEKDNMVFNPQKKQVFEITQYTLFSFPTRQIKDINIKRECIK
ncbi:hypothetical protein [Acinetobacter pittii]|uniref:hypothetical protein n=1 Tax=Acinetobacter pittii TaxID=48296 RepID=UPI0032604BF5